MALSTKYCWIVDLKNGTFLANSRESVRVMGICTGVNEIPSENQALLASLIVRYCHDGSGSGFDSEFTDNGSLMDGCTKNKFLFVTMDDGTESFEFLAPEQMIRSTSLNLELGKTYDCILKLRQNSSVKQWFAETLIKTRNPIDEQYRWMELSHHDRFQLTKSKLPCMNNLNHEFGFPTRRRNKAEIHRLIRMNAQSQQPYHTNRLQLNTPKECKLKRNVHSRWRGHEQRQVLKHRHNNSMDDNKCKHNPSLKSPPKVQLEGISLEDLAIVLQKSQCVVREMIEELQLDGKIYQNERGEYLPI